MDHKVSKDMISSGMIPSGEKTQADLGRTQYGSAPSPSSLMEAYRSIYEHHQKDADGNTIPHEEIEEAATTRIPAQNGNVYELMYSWRGKSYYCKMFFPQPNKPSKDDVEVALNKVYPSAILRNYYISSVNYGDPYIHVGAGDGFTK